MLLKKCCKILSGFAFKSSLFNSENKGIPIVRIRDVVETKSNTFYSGSYSEEYVLNNGDIIIGMDGQFKLAIWNGGNALLNQRVCKLTPNNKLIDKRFLSHILPKSLKEIEDKTPFVTVKHLSVKSINEIELPPYNLATQKHIADILDAADALRRKTQQIVDSYDELAQSLFLEMFGDPVKNEKGWKKIELQKVCNKITDGTHQSPKFQKDGIPFLFVSNIVNNTINFETSKYISEKDHGVLTKSSPIEIGDILYTSVGSYGNPAIIKTDKKFCFQRHIAHIKPNHAYINVVFLHSMMLSPLVKRQADKIAKGVAQKTMNLSEIKKINVFLPPIDLQNQFAEKIALIEQQKELAKQSLAESEILFNALLQKAFKGELVPEPQPAEQAV